MCVSICLPFYNTKYEYMKECLLSIHNQSFKQLIEIIIVNDGSDSIDLSKINSYYHFSTIS